MPHFQWIPVRAEQALGSGVRPLTPLISKLPDCTTGTVAHEPGCTR